MGSSSRLSRSIVRAALLAALASAWAPGARGATCPVPAPVLTGPSGIQAGESYALSWTNVFTDPTASSLNYYVVERALDSAFSSSLDQITTQRSAITLPAASASAKVLYHRIVVKSSCPTASVAAIVSNVVSVPVKSVCDVPPSVGELGANPPNPPAFSTWVVTWDTLGTGPGPGGGPTGLKFRIRRTSVFEPYGREWVVDGGAASFTGAPSDYVFQVRAEASCGSVGPWSPSLRVTVGNVLRPALLLVSEPAPIAALVPAAGTRPTTSFVVRNGGTDPILVRAKPDDSGFVVVPDSFTLAPNAAQTVGVTSLYVTALLRPVHASVLLTAGDTTLSVPVDCMVTAAPSTAKVVWSDPAVDIDRDGDPVLRSIVNPSNSVAAFVATVRAAWLSVASLDGQPWDRPLAANELRTVQLTVDRAKRRSGTGTEVGTIALATVGFADGPETLLVTDDGPPVAPAATGAGATPATAARTRLLYAAFPNAIDARSVGRFAADLWLTNTDAVNPVAVSLLFNPVGAPGDGSLLRRFDLNLAAGETRRYRNVVGTLLGVEGAFTAEVRSFAPTVTATVLVNNRPLPATVAARNASRRTLAGTTPATGQYGFELRPTIPGEGVKQSDPIHVVSGLAHDANRRSNLLLLETSGYDTTVLVALFNSNGLLLTKNGAGRSIPQDRPGERDASDQRCRRAVRRGTPGWRVRVRQDRVEFEHDRRDRCPEGLRRRDGDGHRQPNPGLFAPRGRVHSGLEPLIRARLESHCIPARPRIFAVWGRSGSTLFPDGPFGGCASRERREAVLADARDAHEHRRRSAQPAPEVRRRGRQRRHEASLSPCRAARSSPTRTSSRRSSTPSPGRTRTGRSSSRARRTTTVRGT